MKRLTFLFGHRGTGKTSFLETLRSDSAFTAYRFFDLDQEIEKDGVSVSQIFSRQGEEAFRQVEFQTLEKILNGLDTRQPAVVALGAGFQLAEWNETACAKKCAGESEWVWLRRESDERGRIFLDRPRLNAGLSPLVEFELRYQKREPIFRAQADFVLDLPEGTSTRAQSGLARLLRAGAEAPVDLGARAIYTLTADSRKHAGALTERLLSLGLSAVELRSDLLTADDFLSWNQTLPKNLQLLSHRARAFPKETQTDGVFGIDWALESGKAEIPHTILSLHEDAVPEKFQHDAGQALHKWAPRILNFQDLLAGYEWQQADPDRRSFLPRSEDGRWNWFRAFMKGRQKINFVRMGSAGPVQDQPTLLEWLDTKSAAPFAAVLGDPVWQSQTPSEQGTYFADKGLSTFKIHLPEGEWKEALPVLEKLGLTAAAVTSPLKKKAARIPSHKSARVCDLESANTLARQQGYWHSHNTDEGGLAEAARRLRELTPTLVWGGGGTLTMLHTLWPEAYFYSVRTGEAREGLPALTTSPRLFIWAAGPRDPAPKFPVHPEVVLDLNYREDSAARELSIQVGARYISGLEFFRAQARLQREFWDQIFNTASAGKTL